MTGTHVDAVLACRVQGARLYAKPLQPLVSGGITVLESLLEYLRAIPSLRKIILAISEGPENHAFVRVAEQYHLPYVVGPEADVLQRILMAAEQEGSEAIFRVTTECPFILYEYADDLIQEFLRAGLSFASLQDPPEGTNFEIISTVALQQSHSRGTSRNRSELVTSYICEHREEFQMFLMELPALLSRPEVRLTVDYAEDLVFCQQVYRHLKRENHLVTVKQIVEFWDNNPALRSPLERIGIDWGTGRLAWHESDLQRAAQPEPDAVE